MPAQHDSLVGAAALVGSADKMNGAVSDRAALRPQNVTVIPADHLIMVDGVALTFDFNPKPADLHALHWDGSAVAVERISPSGIMDNARYGAAAYETWVAPFVALWQAEQDRREAEANTPPPPPSLAEKTTYLADLRYAAEQGGTAWRDYTLQTDDRSQAKYLAELAAIDQGVRADPSPWKLTNEFAMLSNADIKAMAIAARAHVMACFAAEAAVQSSLADLPTLDTVATAFATALAQIKEASHA